MTLSPKKRNSISIPNNSNQSMKGPILPTVAIQSLGTLPEVQTKPNYFLSMPQSKKAIEIFHQQRSKSKSFGDTQVYRASQTVKVENQEITTQISKQVNTSLQNIDFEGMYSKLEPKLYYMNIKGDHDETQKSKKISNKSSHFQIEVDTNQNGPAFQSIPDASSKENTPIASKRLGHRNSLSYKESMNT